MNGQYDLPLNKDITARFVPKIVALMVYLSTLCFVFILFITHFSSSWKKELTTHLSIEIPTFNDGSSIPQSKIFEIVNQTPGVQYAATVPQKEMVALFRSLLGNEININLFSLPVIIDISLNNKEKFDIKALETTLKTVSPHIHLIDHRTWQTQVSNLIHTSILIALFITVLTLCSAFATATFATKTSLLIHRPVIEVLSLMGATDCYIAKQFQIYAFKQTLIASIIGAFFSFLTFFAVTTLLEKVGLPLMFNSFFFPQALCIFGLAPFLIALILMFSVRMTVMKELCS